MFSLFGISKKGFKLLDITVIEGIAAFGAELRRLYALFRFPTALVTLVLRNACRLLCTAFRAELTLIDSAAGTGPAVFGRLGRTALGTELTGCGSTTCAFPTVCGLGFGLLCAAFGAELARCGCTTGTLPCVRSSGTRTCSRWLEVQLRRYGYR